MDVEAFRAAASAWLRAQVDAGDAPPDWGPILPPELDDVGRQWQRRLADAGWAGIDWPEHLGGHGLTADHRAAWLEECARLGLPPVLNMVGLVLTAGALLAFGTEDQQREHLPPTMRGDRVWCQLFSEPGAGSDLAALSTRAVRDGDVFVVSGQKVWTSGASFSDWGILLARTDPDAPKHKGISFFVLDMASPGIETRPLRQMTGGSEFDEVFLDDVRVPAANLVGPLHGGWGVAMATLTNERGFIGASTIGLERRLDALAAQGADGAVARDRLVQLLVTGRSLASLGRRQGPAASAASSLLKLGLAEVSLAMASARVEAEGLAALLEGSDASASLVAAPGARLGGGTSEVQRTIIGERILGLPREPTVN